MAYVEKLPDHLVGVSTVHCTIRDMAKLRRFKLEPNRNYIMSRAAYNEIDREIPGTILNVSLSIIARFVRAILT